MAGETSKRRATLNPPLSLAVAMHAVRGDFAPDFQSIDGRFSCRCHNRPERPRMGWQGQWFNSLEQETSKVNGTGSSN